jgi:alkylhydroperoxidase/carboxymuconolactone decarboxylase family protein YurZ
MARSGVANPSDARSHELPGAAQRVAEEHPDLWKAFQKLGEAASNAGPLDAHTRRLVHLALSIAVGSEGATHSHTRRALSEGITTDELEHVALLAITAVGWSNAIKGLTWIRDVTQTDGSPDSPPAAGG